MDLGKRIAIVDYGFGNRQSVAEAVRKIGHVPIITRNFDDLYSADRLILPGVGAFSLAMKNLSLFGLIPVLEKLVMLEKKPLLAICLGFQLLANRSEEFGAHTGLGWIDASVRLIKPVNKLLRIPHIGWNETKIFGASKVLTGIPDNCYLYYVHSYHVDCADLSKVIATVDYGYQLVAAVEVENIVGMQFHPEKSQKYGLKILKNFIEELE